MNQQVQMVRQKPHSVQWYKKVYIVTRVQTGTLAGLYITKTEGNTDLSATWEISNHCTNLCDSDSIKTSQSTIMSMTSPDLPLYLRVHSRPFSNMIPICPAAKCWRIIPKYHWQFHIKLCMLSSRLGSMVVQQVVSSKLQRLQFDPEIGLLSV